MALGVCARGCYAEMYTEFLGEKHEWQRCAACGKLKQVRLQEIRGQWMRYGLVEEGNAFSGEFDNAPVPAVCSRGYVT